MDIRTGKTYETREDAINDGQLIVKFSKGSFKSYRRTESGELERV